MHRAISLIRGESDASIQGARYCISDVYTTFDHGSCGNVDVEYREKGL